MGKFDQQGCWSVRHGRWVMWVWRDWSWVACWETCNLQPKFNFLNTKFISSQSNPRRARQDVQDPNPPFRPRQLRNQEAVPDVPQHAQITSLRDHQKIRRWMLVIGFYWNWNKNFYWATSKNEKSMMNVSLTFFPHWSDVSTNFFRSSHSLESLKLGQLTKLKWGMQSIMSKTYSGMSQVKSLSAFGTRENFLDSIWWNVKRLSKYFKFSYKVSGMFQSTSRQSVATDRIFRHRSPSNSSRKARAKLSLQTLNFLQRQFGSNYSWESNSRQCHLWCSRTTSYIFLDALAEYTGLGSCSSREVVFEPWKVVCILVRHRIAENFCFLIKGLFKFVSQNLPML